MQPTTTNLNTPNLTHASELLHGGFKLVRLHDFSKRPIGEGWNKADSFAKMIDSGATGYGIPLAVNGLCSIDADNYELAKVGMRALGFDLDQLMREGVRTISTRPGSGGRATFAADGEISWIKFGSKETGTILELRAASPNLQDCVPGLLYKDKAGEVRTQAYANGRTFMDAPALPDDLLTFWEECADIEKLHSAQVKFYAAVAKHIGKSITGNKSISTGKSGKSLAFSAPGARRKFNTANKVEEILTRSGKYWLDPVSRRWTHEGSEGAPAIRPIPGKDDLWQSDHGSDPLCGTFDAWTAFVVLEHGGDVESAKRAYTKELKNMAKADLEEGDRLITSSDKVMECDDMPPPFPRAMSALVKEALRVSRKEQPELATLGVLIGMASACDGHFKLPTGMRLNLYGIGVADTGWGKDVPRMVAVAIANICGAAVIGKPGSGQGLEDALKDHKNMLIEMDEVAHVLESLNAKNRASYLTELAGNLLRLFSAGATKYNKRCLANKDKEAEPVEHVCVNLLGYSTPQKLGESMSANNIGDGLMGRLLFAMGRADVTPRRHAGEFGLPDGLVDVAKHFIDQHCGRAESRYCMIEISEDADAMLERLMIEFDNDANASTHPFAKDVMVRSAEKVERIAGVLAVWDNVRHPVMTEEHVQWAERFVRYSNTSVLRFVADFMHGGEVQANAAKVLKAIRECRTGKVAPQRAWERGSILDGVVPKSMIMRVTRMDTKEMDAALSYLEELGDVAVMDNYNSRDPSRKASKVVRLL